MRKPSQKLILRQIRLNIRDRNSKRRVKSPGVCFDKEIIVKFPKIISIAYPAYRAKLLKALKHIHIRDITKKPIFLDFRNVELLYPDGAIYLVHKLDKLCNKINIKGRSSSFTTVRAMLSKLGIHKLMKVAEYRPTKLLRIVERWHIIEGVSAELGDKYDEIEDQINKIVKDKKSKMILHNAISEAITNVINHAYDPLDDYKKWLLFFAIDPERESCYIVLSDLGKTIPATVPVTWKEKMMNLNDLYLSKKDSQLIELATKLHKSATGLDYRGKGFTDIMQVERDMDGSKVMVVSRNGAWSSEAGPKDYPDAIQGTTVNWSLPLNLTNRSLLRDA
ncbi:hypothetical protein IAQ69_07140 [Acinetobacter variabilis]|uniref:ATP-binding protein n=1 Tax=Acinetobacter variabilis TaxID=70346 RepID=A0A7T7WKN2_9GAMM|nr:hypothetical protein [Acinetobacter variabilis]QQN89417.1 hypothetical protein IAQ69_07140 [Acinetobacter variabilis]